MVCLCLVSYHPPARPSARPPARPPACLLSLSRSEVRKVHSLTNLPLTSFRSTSFCSAATTTSARLGCHCHHHHHHHRRHYHRRHRRRHHHHSCFYYTRVLPRPLLLLPPLNPPSLSIRTHLTAIFREPPSLSAGRACATTFICERASPSWPLPLLYYGTLSAHRGPQSQSSMTQAHGSDNQRTGLAFPVANYSTVVPSLSHSHPSSRSI